MTIVNIAQQIELKKQATQNQGSNEWKPKAITDYTVPPFYIPYTRNFANTKKNLAKVLAFVDMIKHLRRKEGCTVIPISTHSKKMISICGSAMGASRLIHYMEEIGLIRLHDSYFQYGAKIEDYNCCRTYRYFVDNEVLLKKYCEEQKILSEIKKNYSVGNTFVPVDTFEKSQVKFSSKLHLLKPENWGKAEFERNLMSALYDNYPTLQKYQQLADAINETYYKNCADLQITFIPSFTWNKGCKAVTKIGIRATNALVSASTKDKEEASKNFCGKFKEDILRQYGLNLEKDVKSSVPRLTLSLNQGKWVPESIDIYAKIWEKYCKMNNQKDNTELSESTEENYSVGNTFDQVREYVKSLHMRGYFDSPSMIGVHTCRAMKTVAYSDREQVSHIMKQYRQAIVEAEGGYLYDNEIFYHESCIYMDVLIELLSHGYFVWQVYDSWYAKKNGVTHEEYTAYVERLVEDRANQYICNFV